MGEKGAGGRTERSWENTAGQGLVEKDSPGTQQNFLLEMFVPTGEASLGQARALSL